MGTKKKAVKNGGKKSQASEMVEAARKVDVTAHEEKLAESDFTKKFEAANVAEDRYKTATLLKNEAIRRLQVLTRSRQ